MTKQVENARVYGDITSGVWVGDKGSTAPVDPTAEPDEAFEETGWLSDDGVTETRDVDSSPKRAWQGGVIVRTVRSGDSRTFKFVCLETKALTMGLVRPGSTPVTTGGITKTPVKVFLGQDIRAWIIDTIDGDVHTRKNIATGEVTDVADIKNSAGDITAYELTVTCYPDADGVLYDELTDDPAQAVS